MSVLAAVAPATDWNWAVVVIPSVITLLGVLVTAFLVRRSHSEDTEVNSFKAISDALFARIENLEGEVRELKAQEKERKVEVETLAASNATLTRQNGALGRYVRKLLKIIAERAPELDTHYLEPDEPIT